MVVFTWSRGMVSSLFEEVQSAEELSTVKCVGK